jgi:nitrogenase molybdenum-cofactor synthesis protein NifE
MVEIMAKETEKKKAEEAYFITTKELAEAGRDNIPEELISSKHLIYSSPATLAYNSPGAQGFGVKRAGLAIPGSVMLLLAPGCCGRNTTILSELGGYSERFFYLMMDETDIVTGRHLKKVPQAVEEIYDCLETKPSVVMICLTCVDALLGTDMERICKRAQKAVGIPVLPCYMYALTREGRKPPMVHVRQSIYSLLEPKKKKSTSVNLLGHFAPLEDDSELYDLLRQLGIKKIREISRCKNYDEYLDMAEANFNLVLHPEARFAAEDFHEKLQIPFIELRRLYQIDKITKQYQALGKVLGIPFEDKEAERTALDAVERLKAAKPDAIFAIGECMNGDPFELALALVKYGFQVAEIYGTLTAENFVYLKHLSELSPQTKVFSNMEPTMIYYDHKESGVTTTIGKDACYYHPDAKNVMWNEEVQPYGYAGVKHLCEKLLEV